MAKRNNKLLVPEARPAMNQLKNKVVTDKGYQTNGDPNQAKFEVAQDLGIPLKKGYNGELTAKQAGKIGGNIGGSMVKEMVKMAEQNLNKGK
jgi:small acid-soluble spore protein D (minor alpha/beta-type SASP)